MKKSILNFLFVLIPFFLSAQGQNPSSVKWMEINTNHAKFIFSEEIEEEAQKAANLIDYLYGYHTKTLKTQPKKIPILLYNHSITSNGFAGLRPRRSGWYMTPSQYVTDLGSTDWMYELASHEFRHVVQYSKSNIKFTKFMSVLFGQTGILMGQSSFPYWFFEGDAISTETAFSGSGRGRIPQFEMGIRTILLNDINIKYDKAKFRSYKSFFPDHYHLGWSLTSYARKTYGGDVFDKTISTSAKYSFWPYAFSRGLKKHTGLNEKKLYKEAMNHLDSVWTNQISNLQVSDAKIINTKKKDSWTKYTEPNFINDNKILVKKSSLKSDITSFYKLSNDGTEKKIKATDAGLISASGNKVVWARTYPDIRWELRSYSDIIIFDIDSVTETRLTKKQKFFAPALSNNASKIAVVEYTTDMESSIVILNAIDGNEIKRFKIPGNGFPRTPEWNKNDTKLTFTGTNEKGTVLYILDTDSGIFTKVTERSFENIGRPIFYQEYIIYNSPYSGIGNIYAINYKTKERFQLTSAKFGAYNPEIKSKEMLYINYGAEGYDIASIDLDKINWKPFESIEKHIFETAETLKEQEQNKIILNPDLIPEIKYEVKKYSKLKDAINIHSWGLSSYIPSDIDYTDIETYKPEVSFDIYSANVLNTVFGVASAEYDLNEQTFGTNLTVLFKKYFPIFSITGSWDQRSLEYPFGSVDEWIDVSSSFGVNLPFNISKGIYRRGINLNSQYSLKYRTKKDFLYYVSELYNGYFSSISYSGSIYNFRSQANQDLNPKFGQFLYLLYNHTPFNENIYGSQFSSLASLYFPGLIKHHSLNIKLGYEKQRADFDIYNYYWFGTPQTFPRGYKFEAFDSYFSSSFNYSFPVWYPDFNIGPFVYFKRVRGNLFFDFAELNQIGYDEKRFYQSAGLELFLQLYVFRYGEPIEIGGRLSYLLKGDNSGQTLIPEFIAISIPF